MRRLPSHPLEGDRCAQSPGARTGQAAVTPLPEERPAVRAARARGSEDAGGPRARGAAAALSRPEPPLSSVPLSLAHLLVL